MREFFSALIEILRESSPYLILGFALAGIIHVLLHRFPAVMTRLTGPGRGPVFMAALLGAPMPLCSCSVLPAAAALRRQGASKATTSSFLISVPETDVVSVLVTLALIGPFFAVYRPLAGVMCALATGLAILAIERRERRAAPVTATRVTDPCCSDDTPVTGRDALPSRRPWWVRAFRYGFIEMFDDIAPQLLFGILAAAAIAVVLPAIDPGFAGRHRLLSYLVMVGAGVPMYVCASASTPIAAGLIAGGVSPGAAMVFLLAGPATNIASMIVLRGELGGRILAVYVAMIVITSVALGALLDALAGSVDLVTRSPAASTGEASAWAATAMVAFLLWTVVSFHRSRLVPRARRRLVRALAPRTSTH